jgi:uncharacterized protein (DUF1810 family)
MATVTGIDDSGKLVWSIEDDPYDLRSRYVVKQRQLYSRALSEIRAGSKTSCWMWYVIPTPPFVVGGVERGSGTNRAFALRDKPPKDHEGFQAARAYLDFPEEGGVSLRGNLVEILDAILEQLEGGRCPVQLMGSLDEPKLRSAAKLFECVSRPACGGGDADVEVNTVCRRLLMLLNEPPLQGGGAVQAAAQAGRATGASGLGNGQAGRVLHQDSISGSESSDEDRATGETPPRGGDQEGHVPAHAPAGATHERKSAQHRGQQVPRARRRQAPEASAARRALDGVVDGLTESLGGFLKLGGKTGKVDKRGGAK